MFNKLFFFILVTILGAALRAAPNDNDSLSYYLEKGIEYRNQGEYPQSLDHLQKALLLAEEDKNWAALAKTYNVIGNLYAYNSDSSKALENYKQSLHFANLKKDSAGIAKAYLNMANIYSKFENISKSDHFYSKALEIQSQIELNPRLAKIYIGLGVNEKLKQNYTKALFYYNKAREIQIDLGNHPTNIASIENNIGQLWLSKNNYEKALIHYFEALKLSRSVSNARQERVLLENISLCYREKGDYEKAYYYSDSAITVIDIMFSEEKQLALAELEEKFKSQRQDEKIKLLRKERDRSNLETELSKVRNRELMAWVIGLSIAVFFILFGLHYSYIRFKSRIERDDLVREKEYLEGALDNLRRRIRQLELGQKDKEELNFLQEVKAFVDHYDFTVKELQLLYLLNQKMTHREIGSILHISHHTVAKKITLLKDKIGLSDAHDVRRFSDDHHKSVYHLLAMYEKEEGMARLITN